MISPYLRRALVVALAMALMSGCATHKVTGRPQLMLIPERDVIQISSQAFGEMLRKQPTLPVQHAYTHRVQAITQRIIQQAQAIHPSARGWPWEVKVFKDDSINAFAMAGGKIGVNSGLLDRLGLSDDELAQVIAHEVAHVISGHTREQMSIAMSQQLGLGIAGAALRLDSGAMQLAGQVAEIALTLPFSRTMEYEADRVGLELAARAGYNPEAALSLWQKMMTTQTGGHLPEWLSTHPANEHRIAEIKALMPRMIPIYQQARR